MSPKNPKKAVIDHLNVLQKVLSLGQHLRLMCVVGCIGVMAGMIAYCYTTPVYYSRTILNWQVFSIPFHEDAETTADSVSYATLWRYLKSSLESDSLIKDTAVRLGIAKPADEIETVKGTVRICRVLFRDTHTLLIELYATDPRIVREFPNALITTYEENQERVRKEYRDKATAKYLAEVEQLKTKINEGLKTKLDFEKNNQFATLTLQQDRLMRLPADIERCKAQIKRMEQIKTDFERTGSSLDNVAKLSLLSAFDREWKEDEKIKSGDVVRRAQTGAASSPFAPAMPNLANVDVVVVDPNVEQSAEVWRKLETEKRGVEEEIRQQSQKYLPGHEVMRQLGARLDQLEHKLAAEAELALTRFNLDFQRTKDRLPILQAQLPEYYVVAERYEQFRKDYALIERGQQDWSAAHNDLTKRLSAMSFGDRKQQIELILGEHELLEDTIPISPSTRKSLMISLALMIAFGVGVPLGIEFINSTVSRLPQLELRLSLTGLGMVPASSKQLLEQIFRAPTLGARVPNFLLECFRVIRSNIILHPGRSGETQVIAITSARPSEGKSTMAANLAWAFFSMGERTLLVDTDLRRGRIHELLSLNNTAGMSTFFSGEASLSEVIQTTTNANLDVITRGPFVPGASDYLAREEFDKLVTTLRQKYDRIILDGPPVLGLSETLALQRVADGVVLVVRAEHTKLTDVDTCVEQLRRSEAPILGFVLNRLDLNKPSNHYYYYYSSPYYYSAYANEPMDQAAGIPA